jgi:hypothetical protein
LSGNRRYVSKSERSSKTFGDRVSIVEIEANRNTLEKYGTANEILINGKRKLIGPALDNEIYRSIQEEITI